MTQKKITIGARGSELALWQANAVADALHASGVATHIQVIQTTGDRRHDVSLAGIGGKGVFIQEIEDALRNGTVDMAVHSLKDVPSHIPDVFTLAGFMEREDPRDTWLHRLGQSPESAGNSTVGTSSPRRRVQLRALHPHLVSEDIRGNVDTRIRKMHSGKYDAIILAAAGLRRLRRDSEVTSHFSVDEMVPAAGQGIITIEVLKNREELIELAQSISHPATDIVARCERALLEEFEGRMDCYTSIAAHASLSNATLTLQIFLSDQKGDDSIRQIYHGTEGDIRGLVGKASADLIARGALKLLEGAAR